MKSSSLGAVVSPSILIPADAQRSRSADTSSTHCCRNLTRWTAGMADAGLVSQLQNVAAIDRNSSPVLICSQLFDSCSLFLKHVTNLTSAVYSSHSMNKFCRWCSNTQSLINSGTKGKPNSFYRLNNMS